MKSFAHCNISEHYAGLWDYMSYIYSVINAVIHASSVFKDIISPRDYLCEGDL